MYSPSTMYFLHTFKLTLNAAANRLLSIRSEVAAMKETHSPYHHGNLRLALVNAAVEQIKTHGVEKLSLRGLARDVGVSQTAPYRHFEDKNHLLAEIATQAFYDLYEATFQYVNLEDSPLVNIGRTGFRYLMFARSNPERYKLMFGPTIQNRTEYETMIAAGQRGFDVLIGEVERGIQRGEFLNQNPFVLANVLWTQVHGLASLVIDGFYDNKELPMPLEQFIAVQMFLSARSVALNISEEEMNAASLKILSEIQ